MVTPPKPPQLEDGKIVEIIRGVFAANCVRQPTPRPPGPAPARADRRQKFSSAARHYVHLRLLDDDAFAADDRDAPASKIGSLFGIGTPGHAGKGCESELGGLLDRSRTLLMRL
jgi:hypothetical protein